MGVLHEDANRGIPAGVPLGVPQSSAIDCGARLLHNGSAAMGYMVKNLPKELEMNDEELQP